jgi:biopolymer transport protein ExbD
MVFSDAYVVEGKRMNADGLRNVLAQLGSIDRNQTIAIKCAPDSPHEKLIQLLDMCSQSGLGNVSLLSM